MSSTFLTPQGHVTERWSASNRCPVCDGAQSDLRGIGTRCFGFRGSGGYVHCSRSEHAGPMQPWKGRNTYAHKMVGSCKCGITHSDGGVPHQTRRNPETKSLARAKPWTIEDRHIESRHPYISEGKVQWELCRIWKFSRSGFSAKAFPRHRGIDGNWYFGIPGKWRGRGDKPLYREEEALNELRLGGHIFIVEGERDADSLSSISNLGTCNAFGAGGFYKHHAKILASAAQDGAPHSTLTIIAHDDSAGRDHAACVYRLMMNTGLSDNRISAFLPPKGSKDLAEFIDKQLEKIDVG